MATVPDKQPAPLAPGKRFRFALESVGLRLALCLVDGLPLALTTALARGVADIAFWCLGGRRRIACENVLRARVTDRPATARRIARHSFRHFAVLVVEALRIDRVFTAANWRDFVELDLAPETQALLRQPDQGLLLASGHLGNWEVAAQLISYLKPVVGVTRPLNNPYADSLMQKRKPRNRFRITPKHGTDIRRLLDALKQGEILAILFDQHARDSRSLMLPFFGIPASTYTSLAMLHFVTRAPLCFGYAVRTGPLRYRLVADPPLLYKPTGNRDADTRAVMSQLNTRLEAAIRAHPEQYLWAHRRWRIPVPPASAPLPPPVAELHAP